ncbi:MAG: hypothetical protein EHM59_03875 [Betaproteobacteria bacterium]|nr:MAG: hypothetical protein EHM59_03875 [Betaproteobacteria bacterium]
MARRARIFATAALALTLASCTTNYDPNLWQTRLKPLSSIEQTMECPEIHLAIDRAETVRWVIRGRGGGTLDSSGVRAFNEAVRLFLGSPRLLFGASRKDLMESGSSHYALDAADVRIRELLQLKRARGCPPRTTALPGMNDVALLVELESVQAKLDAGGDEGQLLKERTRLLDGLRLVPAPAAVPGAPANEEKPAATDRFP